MGIEVCLFVLYGLKRWGLLTSLSFCLYWNIFFFLVLLHTREFFTHMETSLQIFTYSRHLWPLSSEGFLCYTYCDTGHRFIMLISEDTWHTPVAQRLAVELSLLVLVTSVCRDRGSNPDVLHARWTLYHWATTAVWNIVTLLQNWNGQIVNLV